MAVPFHVLQAKLARYGVHYPAIKAYAESRGISVFDAAVEMLIEIEEK